MLKLYIKLVSQRAFIVTQIAETIASSHKVLHKVLTWVTTRPFALIARNRPLTRFRSLTMLVPRDWDSKNAELKSNMTQSYF